MKHGERDKRIDVRVRADDTHAVVEVHSDRAIPSEVMSRLFEPFTARGDKHRHRDGLGLGLFIARSIARARRGDLLVDSSPERGTTFSLVLPRDRARDAARQPSTRPRAAAPGNSPTAARDRHPSAEISMRARVVRKSSARAR